MTGARVLAWTSILLAAVMLLWSRTTGLRVGFWNDEAFSAFYFIEHGPRAIFAGAGVPAEYSLNNHRLFSLLAWATTAVLGPSEFAYRLWAVVPGLLAALIVVVWAIRRLGLWEGAVIALLVALAPLHAEVSTQARGYGLGMLGEALVLVGAVRVSDGRRIRGASILVLGGVVGVGSLSAFAVAFVAQVAPLVFLPGCALPALLALGSVGLASLAFYWPVLGLIAEAGRQEFGRLVVWQNLIDGPSRDLVMGPLALVHPAVGAGAATVVWLALVAFAWFRSWRRGNGVVIVLLLAPILGTYAGFALLGAHVVSRYVSYLLLHVLVIAGIGLVEAVALASRRRLAGVALAGVLVLLAANAAVTFVRIERTRAELPIEGYREAVAAARKTGIPLVVTNSSFGAGFQYYGRDLVRFPNDDELQELFCRQTGPFVYIDYPLHGRTVDSKCLLARPHRTETIPQLAAFPHGQMKVYVVGP